MVVLQISTMFMTISSVDDQRIGEALEGDLSCFGTIPENILSKNIDCPHQSLVFSKQDLNWALQVGSEVKSSLAI